MNFRDNKSQLQKTTNVCLIRILLKNIELITFFMRGHLSTDFLDDTFRLHAKKNATLQPQKYLKICRLIEKYYEFFTFQ